MSAFSVLLLVLRALSSSFSSSVRWAFFIASIAKEKRKKSPLTHTVQLSHLIVKLYCYCGRVQMRQYDDAFQCLSNMFSRLFDPRCDLPAMVAAVSSANSRSFSSCRFSSSLWCFLCSSSITFWWDSSMAAKPLSQVAYETGNHFATVSFQAIWTWTKRFSSCWGGKTLRPYNISQGRSSSVSSK